MARARRKTKKQMLSLEAKTAKVMKMRAQIAAQAVINEASGIDPEAFVRPQNMNLTYDFETRFEKDDNHPQGGLWIKARRGRRAVSVWDSLHKARNAHGDPVISKLEKVSGDELATIYAISKGLQGSPDDGFEPRVQSDRADPHEIALRNAEYGARFVDILERVAAIGIDGRPAIRSKRILKAITTDLVLGDGAGNSRDGARWRTVLKISAGISSDKAQSKAMQLAARILVDALEAHQREWPRLREERARRLRKIGDNA